VERFLRAESLLPRLDDIDRDAHRGPHVVVVDAGGHHVDQHVARAQRGDGDRLFLERVPGLAEAFGADHLRQHLLGHDPELGDLP